MTLRKHNEKELRHVEELIADFDDPEVLAGYLHDTFGVDQEFTDFLIKAGGTEKLREFYYDALKFDLLKGTTTTSFMSEEKYKERARTAPGEFADPDAAVHGVKHRPCLTSIAYDAFNQSARILRNKGYRPEDATLFDHGCGGAKPILIGRSGELGFKFKKAVGIDYYAPILETANDNAKAMKLDGVKFTHANSAQFNDYNGVNVVFMYNPFDETVVRGVAKMLAKYAGKVIVCYNKPLHADCFDQKFGWKLAHEQGNRSTNLAEQDRHLMIFTRGFD